MNKEVEKKWSYGFYIGLIFSVVPAQIYLILNKDLFKGLLIGLICGLIVLVISIYIVYKTTYFRLK